MRPNPFTVAALVLLALPLYAGNNLVLVDKPVTKELQLDLAGSFWIDNPAGTIEISGVDGTTATITAIRTTIATDRDAAAEAHKLTVISFEGDGRMRYVRTIMPSVRSPKWSCAVKYVVKVPRTVHVRVASRMADPIHVSNIMGNVTVKTFASTVILDNVSGASIVDTVNGRVVYNYSSKPVSHAQITAVNASIEVHLPSDSNFDWVADTLRGDLLTTLPIRGRWVGTVFRGGVNAPGGPTLTTATMLGRVLVLGNGASLSDARSVRAVAPEREAGGGLTGTPYAMRIQIPTVPGPFEIIRRIADINIGEVRGAARVHTGGGAIELGTIFGECTATSLGGPISIAEVMGTLIAQTGAGDILVRAARVGGTITTDGGSVKVFYTGGPTTLRSGGGDIIVRQAAGPIDAETRGGDITINSDPAQRTQHIAARTAHGNVILNLSPRFGADVDATVLTSDNDSDAIHSDFKGLQIRREQVGGKTRVRATGKINGGGEKLELYAEEGTIHFIATTASPASVTKP